MNATVDENDVRDLVRMLGMALSGEGGISEKRARVLRGLAELINADSWVWNIAAPIDPSGSPKLTVMMKDGFSEEQFVAYLRSQESEQMGILANAFLSEVMQNEGRVTRNRLQLIDPEVVDAMSIMPIFTEAGIRGTLVSAQINQAGGISIISYFRRPDRPEFDQRETRIAHIVLSEIEWLHENSWPEYPVPMVATLSPRLRSILTCLIHGQARKEIASDFDLSIHTVDGYVKDIYRHFQVNSQAELMRRFMDGDGGDVGAQ